MVETGKTTKTKSSSQATETPKHSEVPSQTKDQACDNCSQVRPPYTGMVLAGKFLGNVCASCRSGTIRPHHDAAHNRAMGRDDNARDIVQPFIDGTPNPDFAHAYPEHAKEAFTEDEMSEM